MVVVPISAAAAAQEIAYSDYIAAAFPSNEVGVLLSLSAWLFALLPAAISGTLASVAGYFVGQKHLKSKLL
jgi:hypothetical protein